jgi:hypothetical protein
MPLAPVGPVDPTGWNQFRNESFYKKNVIFMEMSHFIQPTMEETT